MLINDKSVSTYGEHEDDAAPHQTARRWTSLSYQVNRVIELLQSGNASLDTIRHSALLSHILISSRRSSGSSRDHDVGEIFV